MKDTTRMVLIFMITPFVVSTSVHFLPEWLSIPISFLGAAIWWGNLIHINEHKSGQD
jgi:hypothetical protein